MLMREILIQRNKRYQHIHHSPTKKYTEIWGKH